MKKATVFLRRSSSSGTKGNNDERGARVEGKVVEVAQKGWKSRRFSHLGRRAGSGYPRSDGQRVRIPTESFKKDGASSAGSDLAKSRVGAEIGAAMERQPGVEGRGYRGRELVERKAQPMFCYPGQASRDTGGDRITFPPGYRTIPSLKRLQ